MSISVARGPFFGFQHRRMHPFLLRIAVSNIECTAQSKVRLVHCTHARTPHVLTQMDTCFLSAIRTHTHTHTHTHTFTHTRTHTHTQVHRARVDSRRGDDSSLWNTGPSGWPLLVRPQRRRGGHQQAGGARSRDSQRYDRRGRGQHRRQHSAVRHERPQTRRRPVGSSPSLDSDCALQLVELSYQQRESLLTSFIRSGSICGRS